MRDINSPQLVEVAVSVDGKRLWVNVDGVCELRVASMTQYRIEDPAVGPQQRGARE